MSAVTCQQQFEYERWNCTLHGYSRLLILKKGALLHFILRPLLYSLYKVNIYLIMQSHDLQLIEKQQPCTPSQLLEWLTQWQGLVQLADYVSATALKLTTKWKRVRRGDGAVAAIIWLMARLLQ